MKEEKSCGAIIIHNGKVLIIKQNEGFYGFPKGHVEGTETEVETAIREVKEETNLDIFIDENHRYEISYIVKGDVLKHVIFFLATPTSYDIKCDDDEVAEAMWLDIDEAIKILTYHDLKEVLKNAKEDL